MSDGQKTISFLNRYFIYKKLRSVDAERVAMHLISGDDQPAVDNNPDAAPLEDIAPVEETKQEVSTNVTSTTNKPTVKYIRKLKKRIKLVS